MSLSATDATTPRPARRAQLAWLGASVIVGLVCLVYWPALRGGFVWDDPLLIQRNPLVTGELNLRTIWLRTDFPLANVAFWLQWLAWGTHPAGYHAVNVALHALNALLIWGLLARMKVRGAWLAAALFAVHPVGVASAAWVSEQKNTLSLLFFLASAWCYWRFEEIAEAGQPRRCQWYVLALAAFLAALLAKTSVVMLPPVLLLLAWWRRGRLHWRDGARTAPFFALALGFGLLTVWFQYHHVMPVAPVDGGSALTRLAGAGAAVWFYLGKVLVPANLSMIYPQWQIQPAAVAWWLPLAGLAIVFLVSWRFRKTWGRHALLGLGYFVITLFPALGFVNMYYLAISRVSDHFQYLSMIGVLALVAAAFTALCQRQLRETPSDNFTAPARPAIARVLRVSGVALVLLTLGWLSHSRARVFATDEGLWRDTVARNPGAWPAHNNLGCLLAEQQQYDAAIEHFETALRLYPPNAQAHLNLGRALALKGRWAEAEEHYATSLRLKPAADTRLQYAALLGHNGKAREAADQYRQVLAAQPDQAEALNALAWLLATSRDDAVRNGAEAVRLAERARELARGRDASVEGTLAAACAEAGRFPEAVAHAKTAIDLALRAGDSRTASLHQRLLMRYRDGRPARE